MKLGSGSVYGTGALTEAWHCYECDQHNEMIAPWLFLWRQYIHYILQPQRTYHEDLLSTYLQWRIIGIVLKHPNILASWVCSTHLIVWWEMKSTWLQSQWVPGTLTQPGPWRQMMGNRSLWYSLHCDNNGKHILTFYNQDHWEFNLLNSNLKVISFILIHQHLKPHMNY